MKDESIKGSGATAEFQSAGVEPVLSGVPPAVAEQRPDRVVEDNPYTERLGQMVSMLGEVQKPTADIKGGFLLKLVTGSQRVPHEEFQLFYEAAKKDPRIESVGNFIFRFRSGQTESDAGEEALEWDGRIDGLDIRGLVDEVVHKSQRATEHSVRFRNLLAQVPGICGAYLNEIQFTVFRMVLDNHEGVLYSSYGELVLAPRQGADRKSRDLYVGGPLESETVKEVSDLDAMLRFLRRESASQRRKPYSRRRLHYKRGTNMDESQPL